MRIIPFEVTIYRECDPAVAAILARLTKELQVVEFERKTVPSSQETTAIPT